LIRTWAVFEEKVSSCCFSPLFCLTPFYWLLAAAWLLSSVVLMRISELSSDDRLLETAFLRTIEPLGPVNPAWRDPLTVIR
jgi:hypothetical protein